MSIRATNSHNLTNTVPTAPIKSKASLNSFLTQRSCLFLYRSVNSYHTAPPYINYQYTYIELYVQYYTNIKYIGIYVQNIFTMYTYSNVIHTPYIHHHFAHT